VIARAANIRDAAIVRPKWSKSHKFIGTWWHYQATPVPRPQRSQNPIEYVVHLSFHLFMFMLWKQLRKLYHI